MAQQMDLLSSAPETGSDYCKVSNVLVALYLQQLL